MPSGTNENSRWHALTTWVGVEQTPVRHRERLISAFGGFLGISAIWAVSQFVLGDELGKAILATSMGASAVLLFAIPHGALSQPWPLVGGQFFSVIIGVTMARWVPHTATAAALAVGLSIAVMHYARCVHPPGGATALSAVIGGPTVQALGYEYIWKPVLLNVAIIFIIATLFNFLFSWRRYPAVLGRTAGKPNPGSMGPNHGDFEFALREIDSFVDITEQDLARIFELASAHAASDHLPLADLQLGSTYSNGRYGRDWQVRQVVGESLGDQVTYRIVAGADTGQTATIARELFSHWARYEVELSGTNWKKKLPLK